MKTQGNQMNNISIDDFSERIQIMYHEKKRNERGDIVNGEAKIRCRCFAKIYPYQSRSTNGREVELRNEINYRVTTRYRDDIHPDDFVIWRDKILKLRAPPMDVEGKHIYIQFEALEVLKDG